MMKQRKKACDTHIVRAKENVKLSYGGSNAAFHLGLRCLQRFRLRVSPKTMAYIKCISFQVQLLLLHFWEAYLVVDSFADVLS